MEKQQVNNISIKADIFERIAKKYPSISRDELAQILQEQKVTIR